MSDEAPSERPGRPVIEALGVAGGMVIFAAFSHRGLPWILVSATGLLGATISLERSLRRAPRVAALLGLEGFSGKTARFAAVGGALGAGAGLLHRRGLGLPLLPAGGLEIFAAMACLIGATEELVYRGWLQGRLRTLGWPVAVVAAAAAHAAYKSALFAWPPGPAQIDCAAIAGWTFVGGVVLGLLRQLSGSVVPAMVAHAAFDLLVYGALAHAPWWVWG
jgi:membrane protease YdiL (CAAX protease family)